MEDSDYPDGALRRSALNSLRTHAVEALENTGRGSAARGVLSIVGVKTTFLNSMAVSKSNVENPYRRFLVLPDRSSVGDFAPEIEWSPRVEYSVRSAAEETVVEVQSNLLSLGGSADANFPVEELSEVSPDAIPEECLTRLKNRIDKIDETVASQPQEVQLPWIHARKERATERRHELKERAVALLRQARSVLLAWALVALVDKGKVCPNKILGPSRDFVSEAQKLWKKIVRRRPDDLKMKEIGESAGVPTQITEATEYAIAAIREELTAIEEKIYPQRIEAAACRVVEDRVVEGKLESADKSAPDEQQPWAGREATRYAVDLIHAYLEDPHLVQNVTSDMEDLLEKAGYSTDDVKNRLRSIKRALNKNWEDGDEVDFVLTLAEALNEVGELRDETLMTLHDSVVD